MQKMNYRKTTKRINNQQKELSKQKEKVQCSCQHKKDGQATLVRKKGGNPFEWVCYQCEKLVNLKRIEEDDLQNAISILDAAIDIAKFSCRENSSVDNNFQGKLAKTQYRIRNVILPIYRAALNENQRREKKSSNRMGGNASWS